MISKYKNYGFLLLHGFTGGPHEVRILEDYLNSKGIYTYVPTLPGHENNDPADLKNTSYNDWIRSATDSFFYVANKCRHVSVGGFSMGGLLAAQIAHRFHPTGLISINTPIFILDIKNAIINSFNDINLDMHKHKIDYRNFANVPLSALHQLRLLINSTKPLYEKLTCPALICQSICDEAVKTSSADYIFDRLKNPQKILIKYQNSNHFIHMTEDIELLCYDVFDFFETVAALN